jgi:hypothetical protein
MRRIKAIGAGIVVGVLGAMAFPSTALAWSGQASGVIFQIDVTDGDGYGLRAYLSTTAMCGASTGNWAYLNSSDSNYSTYAAALMMAKATGENVTIFSNVDSGGFCHIGYVMLQ